MSAEEKRKFASLDFETFYSSKDKYSLKYMSVDEYLADPRFDAYLVAITWGDLCTFVGKPENAPWEHLHGAIVAAHNRPFDHAIYNKLKELGVIPEWVKPKEWICTADMAAYFRCTRRNLQVALDELLGIKISKDVRTQMDGKTYADAEAEGTLEGLLTYGGGDSEGCFKILTSYYDQWPERERIISRLNADAGMRGIFIDKETLEAGITKLRTVQFEAEKGIPWDWTGRKTPLSPKMFRAQCRDAGIPCPASVAEDSEECATWEAEYGDKYPWVAAMRDWRKAHILLKKLLTIQARLREDGTFPFSILYHNAHTARFAGASGFNMQNMNAELVHGVDLRGMFIPRPGNEFIIPDLSQIEPRCLNWFVGNKRFLDMCASGISPYEAHARDSMGWTGGNLADEDPKTYRLSKARILALGFGASWYKFIIMMRMYGISPYEIFDTEPTAAETNEFEEYLRGTRDAVHAEQFKTLDEKTRWTWVGAYLQVKDFREKNSAIFDLGRNLFMHLRMAASHKEKTHEIILPSGRPLTYFDPQWHGRDMKVRNSRNGPLKKIYPGKIIENITQATARDVFIESLIRLNEAYPLVFHVHDEGVHEGPKGKTDVELVKKLFTVTPDWLTGCPLDAKVKIVDRYLK